MTIIQNVTVGPTLGADSIRAGLRAAIVGGALILAFMLFYYKFSGVIANFAISINIIMLLGAMAWLNATLTLPGIAGIILIVGMGVDSNVLIFERIKEELRGQGFGHRLLTLAEDEARHRGAKKAHLDTFSFQAPDFYKQHGYEVFGELQDFPPGHQRYFLSKQL